MLGCCGYRKDKMVVVDSLYMFQAVRQYSLGSASISIRQGKRFQYGDNDNRRFRGQNRR